MLRRPAEEQEGIGNSVLKAECFHVDRYLSAFP